jgi:hypothetical protein
MRLFLPHTAHLTSGESVLSGVRHDSSWVRNIGISTIFLVIKINGTNRSLSYIFRCFSLQEVQQRLRVWCCFISIGANHIRSYLQWRDVTWRDVTWRDVTWRDVTWRDAARRGVSWRDTIHDTWWYIWYDMIWYDMIWYDMIWYMIWYDMIWYMIWYICWLPLGCHPVAGVQYTFTHKQYIELYN